MKKDLLSAYEYCKEHNLYIGTGNPEARILIIGKECAKPGYKGDVTSGLLIKWEGELVSENLSGWKSYIEHGLKNDVRFPHPGQLNKQDRKTYDDKNDCYIYSGGTSDTWVKYQRLNDLIFNDGNRSGTINFHDNIFITELNQIPSAFSSDQDRVLRKGGVAKRQEMFRNLDFYQNFPVILMACGHYPVELGFDIEETFGVKWVGKTEGEPQQFYNVHYSADGQRLLIHTRQMSMAVKNELLISISSLIRSFLNI